MVSFETIVVPPPPPGEESDEDKPVWVQAFFKKSGFNFTGTSSNFQSGNIGQQQEDTPCYAEPQVVVKISEDTARGCLLDHVSSHVCYGREAAKAMVITDMEYVPALHYEIQTFTERRETCWSYAPHRPESQGPGAGAGLDTGLNQAGHAPLPWELDRNRISKCLRITTLDLPRFWTNAFSVHYQFRLMLPSLEGCAKIVTK